MVKQRHLGYFSRFEVSIEFKRMYSLIPVVLVLCVSVYFYFLPRADIPKHLMNFPVVAQENLLSEELRVELVNLLKKAKKIPSNVDQSKVTGFKPVHEQIGEGRPIGPNGTCSHPFLFPNSDHTTCIFPERVDLGQHFAMTGGLDGKKENVKDLIARVSSFGKYTFIKDLSRQYPSLQTLFESDTFQSAAKQVCPQGKPYLDPFQFNFVVQVPGQSVALHLDAPYFHGATRYHFPQWLLVAMVFSNLFQDKFIDQVQVVGYLHEWTDTGRYKTGGDFVYYLDNHKIGTIQPLSRSGTIVDGSKMIHAATIYRPDVKAPKLNKDQNCFLLLHETEKTENNENDLWDVMCDNQRIASYPTNELRITLVYRARCFENATVAQAFHPDSIDSMLSLEEILTTFQNDLIANHRVSASTLVNMDRLALGNLIMQTYVKYPLPARDQAWIPYNYCALSTVLPWTEPFLAWICD